MFTFWSITFEVLLRFAYFLKRWEDTNEKPILDHTVVFEDDELQGKIEKKGMSNLKI